MSGKTEYSGGHQPLDVLIHASLLAERAPESAAGGRTFGSTGNVKDSVYRCPVESCSKTFTKKWNLKVHVRLHTGDEPFKCSRGDCKKSFRWRSSLKSHEKTHENSGGRKKIVEAHPPTPTIAKNQPHVSKSVISDLSKESSSN
mmetsp:Transcript_29136/g.113172  ORF Transcript_29136/g.113172 Transcript_29136/m.113172 type:complete len:144 (-) Transcript_29136:305-736(-)|eukprot:CAMPEP_0113969814 /NCGR_PEP_ID=MMETSP0011_2-20120614/10613_1 /TAXON_ID=101924 /ORGANISM="Rhodosorus marinus" /LENGTH=143 /DNA_ID=CAMNT_0000983687 /DNA_START=87 /DNA_END=518 /DNA_ORIENTATION=- /assembly_acc=CAM_ASM_000156